MKKTIEQLKNESIDLEVENDELAEECVALRKENEDLHNENMNMDVEIRELKEELEKYRMPTVVCSMGNNMNRYDILDCGGDN